MDYKRSVFKAFSSLKFVNNAFTSQHSKFVFLVKSISLWISFNFSWFYLRTFLWTGVLHAFCYIPYILIQLVWVFVKCEPIKRTKDLNNFSLCALNLFNTQVSQFVLNYRNKWTFPRHSNLLYAPVSNIAPKCSKLILRMLVDSLSQQTFYWLMCARVGDNFKTFPLLTDECTGGRVCPANFRPAEITIASDWTPEKSYEN